MKRCPLCDASMQEYKRGFSKDMVTCVIRLAEAGGMSVDVADLALTHPQYSNFQRLRFWGLASKVEGDDRGGMWSMTALGWSFVMGGATISRYAITYRGEVKEFQGEQLHIRDVKEGWWLKPRVIQESQPHEEVK